MTMKNSMNLIAQQSWTAEDVMEKVEMVKNTSQQSWTTTMVVGEVKAMLYVQTMCVLDEAC